MKKLFALLLALPLFAFAEGDHFKRYYASINIHSNSPAVYEVYIDGYRYDLDRYDLNINDLRPGSHDIKVIEHCVDRRGYGFAKVIFRDQVFLPHGSDLFACIDRNGRFIINEVIRPQVPRRANYCTSTCHLRHRHNVAPRASAANYRRGRVVCRW